MIKLYALISIVVAICFKYTFAVPLLENEFVYASNSNFVLNDCPFYYGGANSYDLTTLDQHELNLFFSTLAAESVNVVRTWAFANGNGTQSEGQSFLEIKDDLIFYHQNNLVALDRVLATAAKYKIKVVMVLANNWDENGGINYFMDTLNLTTHLDYFRSEAAKNVYKFYFKQLANRVNSITNVTYINDTTIFSWELINEPRQTAGAPDLNTLGSVSAKVITDWAEEMCNFVKTIDSNHMVAVGDEGFYKDLSQENSAIYSLDNGVDHISLSSLPCIDYNTVHLYDLMWGFQDSSDPSILQWIQFHRDIAASLHKPVVLEEYSTNSVENRAAAVQSWQDLVYTSGYAGSNLWNLRLSKNKFSSSYDTFMFPSTLFPQTAEAATEQNATINLYPHALKMSSKNMCVHF